MTGDNEIPMPFPDAQDLFAAFRFARAEFRLHLVVRLEQLLACFLGNDDVDLPELVAARETRLISALGRISAVEDADEGEGFFCKRRFRHWSWLRSS